MSVTPHGQIRQPSPRHSRSARPLSRSPRLQGEVKIAQTRRCCASSSPFHALDNYASIVRVFETMLSRIPVHGIIVPSVRSRYRRPPQAPAAEILDCWDGPAIDHVFCARDGGSAWRNEKCDEVRHFFGLRWATERNAAETLHDDLLAAFVVCAGLRGETFGQGDGCFGFNPARRDTDHADSLGRHFLREALTVGYCRSRVRPLRRHKRSSIREAEVHAGSR